MSEIEAAKDAPLAKPDLAWWSLPLGMLALSAIAYLDPVTRPRFDSGAGIPAKVVAVLVEPYGVLLIVGGSLWLLHMSSRRLGVGGFARPISLVLISTLIFALAMHGWAHLKVVSH